MVALLIIVLLLCVFDQVSLPLGDVCDYLAHTHLIMVYQKFCKCYGYMNYISVSIG